MILFPFSETSWTLTDPSTHLLCLIYTFFLCRIVQGANDATNLAIDDRLIEEARKLGHHRTKKDTVNAALDEYIQRRNKLDILKLFGTIEYDRLTITSASAAGRNREHPR